MSDTAPIIRRRDENLFFVHNCFGSFFRGVLDWVDQRVYPKFNQRVIGTYDKSVEFFQKKKELGRELETKITPCITLDPMYDFSNEERAGRFLWQFSRYAPGIALRLWKSIDLKEQDLLITPAFSRYSGTFEIIMWLDSVYEMMDLRVAFLQLCGGYGRWLRPEFFWTYLIFPERIENFEDEYGYKIDWGNTLAEMIHVDTINKQRLAIPIGLDAMWKLDSFNDSSSKYGSDKLAEYKMSASFTYEVNLPTYMILSNKVDPVLKLSFSLGNTYTKYPLVSPYKILKTIESSNKPEIENIISKNFSSYKIADSDKEATNRIVKLHKDCIRYPLIAMKWNHISNGKLVLVNDSTIADPNFKVDKSSVIYMDSYKDSYLTYLRRCSAAISRTDTRTSKFYNKCIALKKPMVCFLTNEEAQAITPHIGENVTLDPFRRILYSDLLASCESEDDPVIAYETLKEIKESHPSLYDESIKKFHSFVDNMPDHYAEERIDTLSQRLISDFTDGATVLYSLGFEIEEENLPSVKIYNHDNLISSDQYTIINRNSIRFNSPPTRGSKLYIGGELLIIKESSLAGIYEFTAEDETSSELVLDLPKPLSNINNLVVVSYVGKLVRDKDYIVDLAEQTIKINIPSKNGEIIQFFYYS